MNDAVIEEIKARTDLAELVASYGIAVKHAGGSAKACCPFHHEKTPSFNINTSRGFYHCFGCGESGDAIKFVQKMDGLSFMDAIKKLAAPLGIEIKNSRGEGAAAKKRQRLMALMAELSAFYHRCLIKTREAEIARAYLKTRDLDETTCEEWQIGFAPNGMATILKWAEKYGYTMEELEEAGVVKAPSRPGDAGYHRFGGRLMFSIRDRQGRVVAFSGRQLVEQKNAGKYVNSPETPIFKKSNVLFGFDKAAANIIRSPHREAIACEGQIDTIRLHLCGFPVAVASQGTAFTEEHARMLKRVCDSIVLAYDDDAAGHKATVKVGGMMLALDVPVRVAHIPNGDDPDSFLRTHGATAFQKLIDTSESIVAFQVRIERAKEADPKSIDAIARMSHAVLATIAMCPSAILKASMADEVAKLLGLPTAALTEELRKVKVEKPKVPAARNEDADAGDATPVLADDETGVLAGNDAGRVAPPPPREMELMTFLLANDRDTTLDALVGEFLPDPVFAHDFTRRFVESWRISVTTGEDKMGAFAQHLTPGELVLLDTILDGGTREGLNEQQAVDRLQSYIRTLWQDVLRRHRGVLPATGDVETENRRLYYSDAISRIGSRPWSTVKNLIQSLIKDGL